MNEADSRHLSSQLEALGYSSTQDTRDADLVVLNTCVVRQQAEDKAIHQLKTLGAAKQDRPSMTIGLMGCMVGLRESPRLRSQFPFIDVFMPPSDTEPLIDYLAERGLHERAKLMEAREKAIRNAIQDEEYNLPAQQKDRVVTAHVPIVLGCSHACTFCIIPYRRGAERSRPKKDILNEIGRLVDQGVREVTLLGQIVDRYGTDFSDRYDLADLLKEVSELSELQRIRFLTSHPNWMTDKLISAVAEHRKICPQFEIPVQAGNDDVLARMRRGYSVSEYKKVVARIRQAIPTAALHTDVIVGFPGETDEQFLDTYRLIEEMRFDKVHMAKYSERPKTIASRQMKDDVPHPVKEQRHHMIDELQKEILAEKNSSLKNCIVEVLVEKHDEKRERWCGRTPHNKLVFFEDQDEPLGQIVNVHVTWTGPYSLIGTRC